MSPTATYSSMSILTQVRVGINCFYAFTVRYYKLLFLQEMQVRVSEGFYMFVQPYHVRQFSYVKILFTSMAICSIRGYILVVHSVSVYSPMIIIYIHGYAFNLWLYLGSTFSVRLLSDVPMTRMYTQYNCAYIQIPTTQQSVPISLQMKWYVPDNLVSNHFIYTQSVDQKKYYFIMME